MVQLYKIIALLLMQRKCGNVVSGFSTSLSTPGASFSRLANRKDSGKKRRFRTAMKDKLRIEKNINIGGYESLRFRSKSDTTSGDKEKATTSLKKKIYSTPVRRKKGGERDDDEFEKEVTDTVCRIVATVDAKLPSPTSISTQSIMEKIESIYQASTHYQARSLSYMKSDSLTHGDGDVSSQTKSLHDQEEKQLIEFTKDALEHSGFQLLTQRDLDLCEALNAGYLLRLSIAPDVTELDSSIGREFYPELYNSGEEDGKHNLLFDGKILVYRRGYSSEVTKGKLLLPKVDYLQSSLVQRSASGVAKRVGKLDRIVANRISDINKGIRFKLDGWKSDVLKNIPDKVKPLVQEDSSFDVDEINNEKESASFIEKNSIRLGRYAGNKARFVDSPDLDDALNPFLICEVQGNGSEVNTSLENGDMYQGFKDGNLACQYDLGADSTVNTSNSNSIQLLKRVSISNLVNFFSAGGRRRLIKSFLSESELVEPTYEEVILIWRPLPKKTKKKRQLAPPKFVYDVGEIFEFDDRLPSKPVPELEPTPQPLEIRAFDRVPMANVLAVFPKTKLLFRPADALIFDLISMFSLLAVLASQKFDSPKLDIIALISVTFWILRTFFRYSNKLARYDLLVNKFLTSRISNRNLGALRFLFDDAAMQRSRRVAFLHEWLLLFPGDVIKYEGLLTRESIIQKGEEGINQLLDLKAPVRINVEAALDDLVELKLVRFGENGALVEVKEGSKASTVLQDIWSALF